MVRNVFWTGSEYNYTQFHGLDLGLWLANHKPQKSQKLWDSQLSPGGLGSCSQTVNTKENEGFSQARLLL